jgi:hypothetical protein
MPALELNSSTLHHAILRHLFDRGFAPSAASLASHFSVDPGTMAHALTELQEGHGVVLHPHAPEVWIAHPFSTAPTLFAVHHGGRLWWANCAWCSLGLAALAGGHDVTIHSTLGAEGRPVEIHIEHNIVREALWVHFPVPMARAWDNVVFTCSMMLVFDSEQAIDHWCARHSVPKGDVQPIQLAFAFASVWYARHLDPNWSKWTLDEARQIFARFGLQGPIWALPDSKQRF